MNDGEDPFAGVVLDDAFVLAARRRELSAAERSDRARQAIAEGDRLASISRLDRRRRRRRWRHWRAERLYVLAMAAVALAVIVWAVARNGGGDAVAWSSGAEAARQVAAGGGRPTPRPAASTSPLRQATAPISAGAAYAYQATQRASALPVAYDPCRPIAVVLNLRTAPAGGERLVREALERVGTVAGLDFTVESTVDERPVAGRAAFQPDVYGDRWAPVLVAWSDPAETPRLSGSAAGVAGSAWVADRDGHRTYVTGDVTLDGPQVAALMARPGGRAAARALILHELGHLVGLRHVDDARQLMHPVATDGVTDFGAGDLTGLARLAAAARCVPAL